MMVVSDMDVGELDLDGMVVPALNLSGAELMDVDLRFEGRDYAFDSSVPLKGYGAVLPHRVGAALENGRRALLVKRGERYYLYLTALNSATA